MLGGLSDEHLIDRIAAGDRLALNAFVARYQGRVFRLTRALVGDEQRAEDALQETFVEVWRSASSYRGEGSARAWLYGLARHKSWRTLRRRAGEPVDTDPLEVLGVEAGWSTDRDPEQLTAAAEDHDRVWAAMERLDEGDREVLTLRDLEQLSGDEVAALLGMSLPAMKSRLHRARLRLMAVLVEGGSDVC